MEVSFRARSADQSVSGSVEIAISGWRKRWSYVEAGLEQTEKLRQDEEELTRFRRRRQRKFAMNTTTAGPSVTARMARYWYLT
jgi:hypothetical protein